MTNYAENMAAPPSTSSRVAILLLRVLTFVFLLISLIILTTNTTTLEVSVFSVKIRFNDVYSYRYMLGTIVIGIAYTILQIAFTLCHIARGNRVMNENCSILFDFYGDKIISYALATGAAAAFGATKDLKESFSGSNYGFNKFFNKGYASASLLFLGFVCTALLSIISSYALPKRVY